MTISVRSPIWSLIDNVDVNAREDRRYTVGSFLGLAWRVL